MACSLCFNIFIGSKSDFCNPKILNRVYGRIHSCQKCCMSHCAPHTRPKNQSTAEMQKWILLSHTYSRTVAFKPYFSANHQNCYSGNVAFPTHFLRWWLGFSKIIAWNWDDSQMATLCSKRTLAHLGLQKKKRCSRRICSCYEFFMKVKCVCFVCARVAEWILLFVFWKGSDKDPLCCIKVVWDWLALSVWVQLNCFQSCRLGSTNWPAVISVIAGITWLRYSWISSFKYAVYSSSRCK